VSQDSGTTSHTYDNAGNQTSATTARGTVSYTYDSLNRKTAEYSGSTSGTEIASWTYGTAAKEEPYSSTSYDGNGQAWTETVSGYNAGYEPTGSVTTIPSDAGSLASPAGGYTTNDSYTPLTGLPASTSYSRDGGLPAETSG
jgi:YD repeat-containing protein